MYVVGSSWSAATVIPAGVLTKLAIFIQRHMTMFNQPILKYGVVCCDVDWEWLAERLV